MQGCQAIYPQGCGRATLFRNNRGADPWRRMGCFGFFVEPKSTTCTHSWPSGGLKKETANHTAGFPEDQILLVRKIRPEAPGNLWLAFVFGDFVFSLPDGHLCVLIFVAKMSWRFYPTIFRHDVSPRTPRHPLFRHVSAPHPSATNSPVIYQRASQGRWQWWTVRRLLVLPVHAQSEECVRQCRGKRLQFSSQ